mgnify:CR=1 FL=1
MTTQEITTDFCENLWKQHISKKLLGFVPEKYGNVNTEIFLDILDFGVAQPEAGPEPDPVIFHEILVKNCC